MSSHASTATRLAGLSAERGDRGQAERLDRERESGAAARGSSIRTKPITAEGLAVDAAPSAVDASGSAVESIQPVPLSGNSSLAPGGLPIADQEKTVIRRQPPLANSTLPPSSLAELRQQLVGERLGIFELQEFIGGGGMGAVFRALDTDLNRMVALKILAREQSADDETIRRFRNEAQSAARLDHENVARVYGIGEDRGLHFIAFEYIEGVNIRALVDRGGPLPIEEALSYTIQIAEALAHSNSRGVVHRDIKPSNVLITAEGGAKLVDMGLARVRRTDQSGDDLTASGVTLGTFDYISPEQARDPRMADIRSDLYSLGCTLYFMLAGRPPFPEGTVLQKLLQHQGDAPPDPAAVNPEVSPELSAIVARLMAKDPQSRYQTPSDLLEDLLPLIEAAGWEIRPGLRRATTPRLASPWSGHMRWLAPVAALILMVLVLHQLWSTPAGDEVPLPSMSAATDESRETAARGIRARPNFIAAAPPAPGTPEGAPSAALPHSGEVSVLPAASPSSVSPGSVSPGSVPSSSVPSSSVPSSSVPSSSVPSSSVPSSTAAPATVPSTSPSKTTPNVRPGTSDSARNAGDGPATAAIVSAEGPTGASPEATSGSAALAGKGPGTPPAGPTTTLAPRPEAPERAADFDPSQDDPRSSTSRADDMESADAAEIPAAGRDPEEMESDGMPGTMDPADMPEMPEDPFVASSNPAEGSTLKPSTKPVSPMDPGPTQLADAGVAVPMKARRPTSLIVTPNPKGESEFSTLRAALQLAKDGDVVELRFNGPRDEPRPIQLENVRVTIRAGENFQPVVRFRPHEVDPLKYARSMFLVAGGQLTIYDVALELDVPRHLPADRWTLIELEQAEQLRLERCTLTVRNANDSGAAYHSNVSFLEIGGPAARGKMMEDDSLAPLHVLQIQLQNCVARGEAVFLKAREPHPISLVWENGLLVTSEQFCLTLGQPKPLSIVGQTRLDLRHLTALTRGGLYKSVTDETARFLLPVEINCVNSILLGGGSASFVEQVGVDPGSDYRKSFSWSGNRNIYQGYSAFWRASPWAGAGAAPQDWTFQRWLSHWTSSRETAPVSGAVLWRKEPDLSARLHEHRPTQYELAVDQANPPRSAASDGRDIGMDGNGLPSPEVRLPSPATEGGR